MFWERLTLLETPLQFSERCRRNPWQSSYKWRCEAGHFLLVISAETPHSPTHRHEVVRKLVVQSLKPTFRKRKKGEGGGGGGREREKESEKKMGKRGGGGGTTEKGKKRREGKKTDE